MASKAGRRGTKRKAEVLEEKPSVEENRGQDKKDDQERQRVVIEHWLFIVHYYTEVKSALLAAHPGLTVVLNPEKPRRNSFEITLLDGGKETSLWTGIKKGPPRKLKFPQPDDVVAALQEVLKNE
ncbi:Selenoprotein H [Collichthys lucidus]|uniref:Selenoprotein H n=1 Tax=Collichthys lucidus TaxID=240159 RepID=A0A4U5UCZ7_COLLU|nr:Selenoprotein H [Collichthys lucidus]